MGESVPNGVMTHEAIQGSVGLRLEVATLLLAVLDGVVDEVLVGRLVCRREDERGVGGGILGLIHVDR